METITMIMMIISSVFVLCVLALGIYRRIKNNIENNKLFKD